jgi:hypothetical protein
MLVPVRWGMRSDSLADGRRLGILPNSTTSAPYLWHGSALWIGVPMQHLVTTSDLAAHMAVPYGGRQDARLEPKYKHSKRYCRAPPPRNISLVFHWNLANHRMRTGNHHYKKLQPTNSVKLTPPFLMSSMLPNLMTKPLPVPQGNQLFQSKNLHSTLRICFALPR